MPTGYTDKILKGASTKEFALECSRAFTPLMFMRDEPLGVEIPDTIEDTESGYHQAQLETAEKYLKRIKKMSYKRAGQYAENDYRSAVRYHQSALQEKAEGCFKLAKAMAAVAAYTPPTEEHVPYKDFMINQIKGTIEQDGNPDYHIRKLAEIKCLSPQEWKQKQISQAQRDVTYHAEQLIQSQQINLEKNQWMKQLRRSLDQFS